MKASLKFREEQKPLMKARIPLKILGIPFQSSISAGDSKELSLGLATFFDFGPSFRLSYRPNDAFHPFSLLLKTGIGHFGSPIDAPITMSAEFNFFHPFPSTNPTFFLHFKPHFGDFSIKKFHSSTISAFNNSHLMKKPVSCFEEDDSSLEIVEKPCKITVLPLRSSLESAVSGVELGAKTALPIRNGAVLKLRWGVKFPEGFNDLFKNPTAKISPRGIPMLVLNKIGIEHVAKEKENKKVGPIEEVEVGSRGSGRADLAETCFSVKRQLETLRSENAVLGKALEDLKRQFGNKGFKVREGEGDDVGGLGVN